MPQQLCLGSPGVGSGGGTLCYAADPRKARMCADPRVSVFTHSHGEHLSGLIPVACMAFRRFPVARGPALMSAGRSD